MSNCYKVEGKRIVWNKNGKFWFESVEEKYAYGDSWEEVKERLGLNKEKTR